MGRILSYIFSTKTKEEYSQKRKRYKKLLADHRKEFSSDRYHANYCDECIQADRFLYCEENDHERLEHQRVNHSLPYSKIFTKEKMCRKRDEFLLAEKNYEVSVLAMILDEWPADAKICIYRYD